MTPQSTSNREKIIGVVIGCLVLLGLYGLVQMFAGGEELSTTEVAVQAPAEEVVAPGTHTRPRLPPSGKMSNPPRGASGGGGPGGGFQVIGDADNPTGTASSNPFASGGAGKRRGSGGGNPGGSL